MAKQRLTVAICWGGTERRAVVVIREVLDVTTTDDEVKASLGVIPEWLSSFGDFPE